MVISRWKRGGVPVSVALFDLEAGCPVSILPCFVTSLFMGHISFPRKQVKLKEQGTHSSSAHRANVGEKTNKEKAVASLAPVRPGLATYGPSDSVHCVVVSTWTL